MQSPMCLERLIPPDGDRLIRSGHHPSPDPGNESQLRTSTTSERSDRVVPCRSSLWSSSPKEKSPQICRNSFFFYITLQTPNAVLWGNTHSGFVKGETTAQPETLNENQIYQSCAAPSPLPVDSRSLKTFGLHRLFRFVTEQLLRLHPYSCYLPLR
jgi:hypothetical protein